jgi:cyclophilin family peptidyl-prolyl cis-trans isomerase
MRIAVALACILFFAAPAFSAQYVDLETNRGTIRLELFGEKAPETVRNFLAYADAGHYDGTIFHRVIDDFMIQGGGYTEELVQKPTRAAIRNEAANGLKNERGTIAMARTNVVDSATSQFFINLKNNSFLNHRGKDPGSYGYAVFGRVVSGMDVADRIGKLRTTRKSNLFENLPEEPVIILKVQRVEE